MKQEYTYKIGFNYGYLLAKYKQALIARLIPFLTKKHEFLIGISDGKEENELEIQKNKLHEIDSLRSRNEQDIGRELLNYSIKINPSLIFLVKYCNFIKCIILQQMSISLKTHKMLWGRSGNICAFPACKKELVMDISETDDISVVGEEAHIVAREEDGPRGNSTLNQEQRNKYTNLILLCSIHHKVIDDHPENYPVEKLKTIKQTHELLIRQNNQIDNERQKDDELYATYVDELARLCNLNNFKGWTSFLIGGADPSISIKQYENLSELTNYILSRVWPKRYIELEDSIINLNIILNDFLKVFDKYSEESEKNFYTRKFYKTDDWNQEKYHKLLTKFNYHVSLINDLVFEFTRALNFIFDNIRRFVLSSYRIKEGLLLLVAGPFMDFTWKTYRTEYKIEERASRPYPGLKKFMEIRNNRDIVWGEGVSNDYFPPRFDK